MGIISELFIETEIKDEFLCSICQDVLEEPSMLEPCEHTFCKKCIHQYHEAQPGGAKTCPTDRQAVTGSRPPPRIYLNLLNDLKLRCTFCASLLRLGDYHEHQQKCEYSPHNPKPCPEGCGALLLPVVLVQDQNHNCIAYLKERNVVMQQQLDTIQEELDRTRGELQATRVDSDRAKQQWRTTGLDTILDLERLMKSIREPLPLPALPGSRPRVFFDMTADGGPLGRITIELRADVVPLTAENFRILCYKDSGFGYKGSLMHRILPGYMCYGGDFTNGNGTGGESIYGEKFADENFQLTHDGPGILSMTNYGPNTNGSQFFITLQKAPFLDGKHVVFGSIVDGMDVVKKIEGFGTQSGNPFKKIVIADCGELGEL